MIFTIDDFLEQEDVLKYKNYIIDSGLSQNIRKDDELSTDFWSKYGEKLNKSLDLHFSGVYPQVTLTHSRKPVSKHTDSKFGDEKFKILIYLNTIRNGGTIFFMSDNEIRSVNNKENRLVVFDMMIPHESEKFTEGQRKMAIGFRLRQ
jgi:hypothetical protein